MADLSILIKTGCRYDEEVMQQLDPDFKYNANRYK
jgi:hypothetical protein